MGLRERVVVGDQGFVEIRQRKHEGGPDKECGGPRSLDHCSLGKRTTGNGDGHGGRRAGERVVVGEQCEQRLLAECRVPGPAAQALQPLDGLVVERRLGQGIADERCLEEAFELGGGAGELVERLREDGDRLVAAKEGEVMAEQERGLGSPDRVAEQRVRLPQVLDRGVAAEQRLAGAKLEQQLGALGGRGRLGECAAKVRNGALRGTARARPARRLAEHRDHAWIAGAGCEQQLRGHPFGLCPGSFEQPRRPCMPAVALGRGQRLVDGRPDQRMHEPERRLRAQDVDPGERDRRLGGGLLLQVGERRRLRGIGVLAQDRHCLREPRRLRRETG